MAGEPPRKDGGKNDTYQPMPMSAPVAKVSTHNDLLDMHLNKNKQMCLTPFDPTAACTRAIYTYTFLLFVAAYVLCTCSPWPTLHSRQLLHFWLPNALGDQLVPPVCHRQHVATKAHCQR